MSLETYEISCVESFLSILSKKIDQKIELLTSSGALETYSEYTHALGGLQALRDAESELVSLKKKLYYEN